jgi:hypothetical protein
MDGRKTPLSPWDRVGVRELEMELVASRHWESGCTLTLALSPRERE